MFKSIPKHHRLPLFLGGITVYLSSSYLFYMYFKIKSLPSPPKNIHLPENQDQVESVYSKIASKYDSSLDWMEWMLRMGSKRSKLLSLAQVS